MKRNRGEEKRKKRKKKKKKKRPRKVWILVRFCMELYGTMILYGKIMGISLSQT